MSGYGTFYQRIKQIVRAVTPAFQVEGTIEDGPAVYICHHQNLKGPIYSLLWFPTCVRPWILHVFFDKNKARAHYEEFTFVQRFGWGKRKASFFAGMISPFVAKLISSSGGIPVYRDSAKTIITIKQTLKGLKEGDQFIIFPDVAYADNSTNVGILYDGFLSLDRFYYKENQKHIPFIPLALNLNKHLLKIGTPVLFTGELSFDEEKEQVVQELVRQMNTL